jgi:hypothetical protein
VEKNMTDTNINFNKRKLESLKSSTKPTWYYAQNFEGLALLVGKKKKTYYAHWAIPVVNKITGNRTYVGKRKKLGGFHIPLDEIKALVRRKLDDFKKVSLTADGSLTMGGLCSAFIKNGSAGYRVKVKGAKIKYKKKTTFNNNLLLSTYVLLKTKKPEIISMISDPFKYNGAGYVVFRINKVYSKKNKLTQIVKDWDGLFNKFPPGDPIISTKYKPHLFFRKI